MLGGLVQCKSGSGKGLTSRAWGLSGPFCSAAGEKASNEGKQGCEDAGGDGELVI